MYGTYKHENFNTGLTQICPHHQDRQDRNSSFVPQQHKPNLNKSDRSSLHLRPLGSCHEGGDFHLYRLDNNGTWSHKPGQTRATNLDDAKRVITDPRTADTGVYEFVCFMIAEEDSVVNASQLNVNQLNVSFLVVPPAIKGNQSENRI